MPQAAPRWCSLCQAPHPYWEACPARVAGRREDVDRVRPGPRRRGYDGRWERARAEFLAENPHCVECGAATAEVHHEVPHRGDPAIFWDRSRWRGLCRSCHSAATLEEIRRR